MAAEAKKESKKDSAVRVSPRTFDTKQREEIMKKWYALREKGENAQDAAKKVGVSYLSLHKWEARFGGKPTKAEKAPKDLKPVASLQEHREKKVTKVEMTSNGKSIMVTTPNGFRVELPDIDAVKQLIS